MDHYYNHEYFQSWQHWGMAICNPHTLSPLYNGNFNLTIQVGSEGIDRLFGALRRIPKRAPITDPSPAIAPLDRAMSVRQAIFAPCEELPAKCCAGRVLAQPSVSCPPAVPIAICGERLTEDAVKCFEYYGTGKIWVVKE